MGRQYDAIDDRLERFLTGQPVFFVGTAPLDGDGHVNVSPKGLSGSFVVLGPRAVAYLDLTGSGAETIAHIRENGRVTLMFCAFEGPPRVVRLSGRGRVVLPEEAGFASLVERFPVQPGTRSVIVVDLDRVADSCGYGVPLMRYDGDRDQLVDWAVRKGDDGIVDYWRERNAVSVDGLPALGA
jgi:pyridoxamine 5'-phosphate oxidase-like protein